MLRKLLLGTALATLGGIGSANALVIDSFDNPADTSNIASVAYNSNSGVVTINENGTTTNPAFGGFNITATASYSAIPAGILGGTRTLSSFMTGLSGGTAGSVFSQVSNGGAYEHSQTGAATGGSSVTWDAGGAGLGGVDLGATGTAFHLTVLAADLALLWSLEVQGAGGSAYVEFASPACVNTQQCEDVTAPLDLYVAFASFTPTGDTLDNIFGDVDRIIFNANIDGGRFANTMVDVIETVPEPATMTLLGAGLAGIGLLARRRRKSA